MLSPLICIEYADFKKDAHQDGQMEDVDDFVYESCYRGTVFCVKKTKKISHGESIEQ